MSAPPQPRSSSVLPFLAEKFAEEVMARRENTLQSDGFGFGTATALRLNGALKNNGRNPMDGQTSQPNTSLDLFTFSARPSPPSTCRTSDRSEMIFQLNQEQGLLQYDQALPLQLDPIAGIASFLTSRGAVQGQGLVQNHQAQALPLQRQLNPIATVASAFLASREVQQQELILFLHAQEEHMHNAMRENGRITYNTLMSAAKESLERGLKESEKHTKKLSRRNNELVNEVAKMRVDSLHLQKKVEEQNKMIVMLQTQIWEKGRKDRAEGSGETSSEGSAFANLHPHTLLTGVCRECESRAATMVIMPCRHLCLCEECNEEVSPAPCHVCHQLRSTSFRVKLN